MGEAVKIEDTIINSWRTSVVRCPPQRARNTAIHLGQAVRDWRGGEYLVSLRLLLCSYVPFEGFAVRACVPLLRFEEFAQHTVSLLHDVSRRKKKGRFHRPVRNLLKFEGFYRMKLNSGSRWIPRDPRAVPGGSLGTFL